MTTNTLRIVSLVPSITETLSALGLADAIVGRTGFCIHPREIMPQIPKVGGTKDIDLAKIRALAPTHVVMNVEENRREDYDAIQAFCPNVLATYPQTPADNIELYRTLGTAFDRRSEAESLVTRFTAALESAQDTARAWPIERVLYLIWRDPWMSVARETYISRMLAVVNWETAPTPSSIRYPTIDLAATTTDVARVLLSSEPYRFAAKHVAEVQMITGRPAALIDGEMTSWYGVRAIAGIEKLTAFRRTLL